MLAHLFLDLEYSPVFFLSLSPVFQPVELWLEPGSYQYMKAGPVNVPKYCITDFDHFLFIFSWFILIESSQEQLFFFKYRL